MPTRTEITRSLASEDYPGLGRYVWRPAIGSLEWSPGLMHIFGRSSAPTSESEFMACLHPDDRIRIEGETEAFLTGDADSYSHSFRIVRPDGTIRHIIDRARIIRDAADRVTEIHGINIDVTEFPHLARASINDDPRTTIGDTSVREFPDKDRLELGQRTSGLALADIDYRENTVTLTAAAARLYGIGKTAMTVSRDAIHATFHPEDRAALDGQIAASVDPETGGKMKAEHRIVLPDGTVRWLQIRKRIDFATVDGTRRADRGILAAIDITDRRQAEASLRGSEERLALAQQVTGIGVWDVNLETGRTVWTSELYNLLGVPKGTEVSPDLFFEHVHPEDVERVKQAFASAIEGNGIFRAEFRVVLADGEVRHVAGRGSAADAEKGSPRRIIGVNYDITDRKRTEEHIGVLLNEVNHRSKNLLALVGIIARRTATPAEQAFVDRFVDRISALARNQDIVVQSNWQRIPLAELIRAQLCHFEDVFDSRIHLGGPPITLVPEAAEKLGMALYELATNAGKYGALSNDTGQLWIEWRCADDADPRFEISWKEEDGPPVRSPSRTGFGSLVTGQYLEMGFGGETRADYPVTGFNWTFACPQGAVLATTISSELPDASDT